MWWRKLNLKQNTKVKLANEYLLQENKKLKEYIGQSNNNFIVKHC